MNKVLAISVLFMAALLVFVWSVRGPDHPIYAFLVASWTLGLGPFLAAPVMRRLPRRFFRVPEAERIVHRLLGVALFRGLLELSGWERHVHKRQFTATKAGLPSLEAALRGNASAHGVCFAIHILIAAGTFFTGHPRGALWILVSGVIVHLYPVLLQRSIMLRLQRALEKSASRATKPQPHDPQNFF